MPPPIRHYAGLERPIKLLSAPPQINADPVK